MTTKPNATNDKKQKAWTQQPAKCRKKQKWAAASFRRELFSCFVFFTFEFLFGYCPFVICCCHRCVVVVVVVVVFSLHLFWSWRGAHDETTTFEKQLHFSKHINLNEPSRFQFFLNSAFSNGRFVSLLQLHTTILYLYYSSRCSLAFFNLPKQSKFVATNQMAQCTLLIYYVFHHPAMNQTHIRSDILIVVVCCLSRRRLSSWPNHCSGN